nr:sugar transferase [uncultured Sphingomonas sp.]
MIVCYCVAAASIVFAGEGLRLAVYERQYSKPKKRPVDLSRRFDAKLLLSIVSDYKLTYRLNKRLLDLYIATIALTALAPLFLVIALLIKFDSRGPVFFRQKRFGFRGDVFTLVKFRTMHVTSDGETRRLTRVGQFLRTSSIDELPQLFAVLKGDMSLVGPRPGDIPRVVGEEVNGEGERTHDLLTVVKPGITGIPIDPEAYFLDPSIGRDFAVMWYILKRILKDEPS